MPLPHLPPLSRPALLGPSRRARWRRWALRRGAAAGCAATAVVLLVGVVRPPPPGTTAVVVAARALGGGTVLDSADLRVVHLTDDAAMVATVRDPGALVGRRLTSRIEGGEPVTTTRLVPASPMDGAPPGTVAAHLLVADEGSLDLVTPGRRVSLYPETGGPSLARGVLVLSVDTPDRGTLTQSLPGPSGGSRGVVVALETADLDRIFAGQRPEGGPPRVLVVVTA